MPDFRVSEISVVMLGVADAERSVEFYRDRLGLTLKNQMPGFAFFDAGRLTLAISEPLGRTLGQGASRSELVFPVTHVREAVEALRANGVEFLSEPRNVNGPFWAANFVDPDGHHLSVFGNE